MWNSDRCNNSSGDAAHSRMTPARAEMNECIGLSAVLKASRVALQVARHLDVERIEQRRCVRRDLEARHDRQGDPHTERATQREGRTVPRVRVAPVANEAWPRTQPDA